MSRIEDRTIDAPPELPGRHDRVAEKPFEPDAETSYASLPLKPTRAVAVTVRRIGKIAPRLHRAEEQD